MKFLLFLLSFSVSAENWLHLGMYSKHPESGMNEKHDLIGIEIDNYFLYKFENSFNDTSYYLGKINRDVFCLDNLCAGYSYGIIKGYEFKEISPIAFAVFSYEKYGVGMDISYLPGVVASLQFRFSDKAFQSIGLIEPWNAKGYLELSYDSFDPDGESWLGYERSHGLTYDAKIYLSNKVYLKGSYTTTDFGAQATISDEKYTPVWKTNTPSQIDSRGSIQIGKDYKHLSVGISYNQISIQENYFSRITGKYTSTPEVHYKGFGWHISRGYQLGDDWSFYTEAAIVSDLITDLRLTLETRYKITDKLEISLRTIDFERYNYSQYQLGLRYNL